MNIYTTATLAYGRSATVVAACPTGNSRLSVAVHHLVTYRSAYFNPVALEFLLLIGRENAYTLTPVANNRVAPRVYIDESLRGLYTDYIATLACAYGRINAFSVPERDGGGVEYRTREGVQLALRGMDSDYYTSIRRLIDDIKDRAESRAVERKATAKHDEFMTTLLLISPACHDEFSRIPEIRVYPSQEKEGEFSYNRLGSASPWYDDEKRVRTRFARIAKRRFASRLPDHELSRIHQALLTHYWDLSARVVHHSGAELREAYRAAEDYAPSCMSGVDCVYVDLYVTNPD